MTEPVTIGGGWKALNTATGVIVQAEMGLIHVFGEQVDADGNFTTLENAGPPLPPTKVIPSDGPSHIAAFLKETEGRDFSNSGIYGPLGATIKKLRKAILTVEPNTELEDTFGEFLAAGNHDRHGSVAAIVDLNSKQLDALNRHLQRRCGRSVPRDRKSGGCQRVRREHRGGCRAGVGGSEMKWG